MSLPSLFRNATTETLYDNNSSSSNSGAGGYGRRRSSHRGMSPGRQQQQSHQQQSLPRAGRRRRGSIEEFLLDPMLGANASTDGAGQPAVRLNPFNIKELLFKVWLFVCSLAHALYNAHV